MGSLGRLLSSMVRGVLLAVVAVKALLPSFKMAAAAVWWWGRLTKVMPGLSTPMGLPMQEGCWLQEPWS